MEWAVTNFIAAFLLPPLSFLLLLGAGLWLLRRRPRVARTLLFSGFVLLWVSSTPFVVESGLRWLESEYQPVTLEPANNAEAIVVLGGSLYFHAPEYAGETTVNGITLQRLSYGARLHRQTGLPILVTGGAVNKHLPEGVLMQKRLQEDFRVPVRWAEDRAINTFENARFSAEILKQAGISRIYLVTHAWHMPRSVMAFRNAGFEVTPAPMSFTTRFKTDVFAFIPSAITLRDAYILMHELIGKVWYQLRMLVA
ncbi:MAG TPA: YdcF family protein [Methylophilaceae bacterium]|nr:YdcF family protein [Methylophilaceae bacterium]